MVHLLHDNPDWLPPFRRAFADEGLELVEHRTDGPGTVDLTERPEPGVWWSRLSASAWSRGHADAYQQTLAALDRLEIHGARVVNGRRAAALEVDKVHQLAVLTAADLDVPPTRVVTSVRQPEDWQRVADAAEQFAGPVIVKPNRGGKGLGVSVHQHAGELRGWGSSPSLAPELPVDGVVLVQAYLRPREPWVTRVEVIGGRPLYAVRAATTDGFELCPAEACAADGSSLFQLRDDLDPAYAQHLATTLQHAGVEIGSVEFLETTDGRRVVYDVNTTTNYNPGVDTAVPVPGPVATARYLRQVALGD